MEDVILRRRRRSQRTRRNSCQDQQRPYSLISTGSSRLSATSTSTTASAELRRSLFNNSVGSSAPSYMSGVSSNSLLSVDTGFAVGGEESPKRTHSWQPQSAGGDEIANRAHQKVSRNKSSPGCLVHSTQQQQQQQKVHQEEAATVGLGSGFQQFLRRMSMRRSAALCKPRPLSGTNAIRWVVKCCC